MFAKQTENGMIILLLYVNDAAIVSSRENIEWLFGKLQSRFTIKTEYRLNDFLGCDIIMEEESGEGWLLQPNLVSKLQKTFSELLKKKRKAKDARNTRKSSGEGKRRRKAE